MKSAEIGRPALASTHARPAGRGTLLDTRALRSCLGKFATGVTVVSLRTDAGPRGITVNAFASVSLDPPLVLVSIARKARTHGLLADRPFAVNVLTSDQEPIAKHFAGHPQGGLQVPWVDEAEVPRLDGALAWLRCHPWEAYEAGDHTLYLGEVVAFEHRDGDALGYFSSRFVAIARPLPSEPPLPYDPFELPYDAI